MCQALTHFNRQSMPKTIDPKNSSNHADTVVLSWTVHLARKHPLKLITSLALIAAASAAGYQAIGVAASVLVAAAMVASLADFLFPNRYVLTTGGAECRMLLKSAAIRWENVKRCYLDDQGVKLSPLDRQSRLEAFRGVYLVFGENQQQVIETVKSLRAKACTE